MAVTKDPIYPNQVNPSKTERWGEFDKFIPQHSPAYLEGNATDTTVTQVFKGPIVNLYKFQDFCDTMLKSSTQSEKELGYFMSNTNNFIQWAVGAYVGTTPMYTTMYPPEDSTVAYVIDSYTVEECNPAGLMCIVRVKFTRVAKDEEEDPEPDYTYWQCKMQPTQIDVLAYCSNKAKQGETGKKPGEDKGTYATRIQAWWNQPTDTAFLKPEYKFQSIVGTESIEELNSAETQIAKYLEAGQKPLRHYPVIVKKQVYTGKPKIDFSLIDHIVTETQMNRGLKDDEENPFDLDGWEWLCTGIDADYNTTTKVTTVSTEYTGSEEWDKHFYGDKNASSPDEKRWEFGAVYVESNNT